MYLTLLICILLLVAGGLLYLSSFRIRSKCWVRALCSAEHTERKVALTFDDGSDATLTPQVLDVLKAHGAEAAFFVVGERIVPELVVRMHEEGHVVGNHTLSHRAMGPFASSRKMIETAQQTDKRIEACIHRRPRLFRPPFGVTNPMIGRMVRSRGYTVIGWSIRSFDTLGEPRQKVVERIQKQLHGGAIILLHDNREQSPQLVEEVLGMIDKEGYEVVRVDKLLGINAYNDEK